MAVGKSTFDNPAFHHRRSTQLTNLTRLYLERAHELDVSLFDEATGTYTATPPPLIYSPLTPLHNFIR